VPSSRALFALAAAALLAPGPEDVLALLAGLEDTLGTYLALAASTLFVSELAPIVGGMAVPEGRLGVARVVAAVTLGGWAGTTLLYVAGRLKWDWVRRRSRSARAAGTLALRLVARYPVRASFLVRFLFGARILLPMACGAARVPLATYLPLSFLGSLAWSAVFTAVGVAAGEAAEAMLRNIAQVERTVQVAGGLLLLAAAWWWWRRRQRRVARRRRAAGQAARDTPS
jgi:membrane protein DedA with SNARE-associated domain